MTWKKNSDMGMTSVQKEKCTKFSYPEEIDQEINDWVLQERETFGRNQSYFVTESSDKYESTTF